MDRKLHCNMFMHIMNYNVGRYIFAKHLKVVKFHFPSPDHPLPLNIM